MRRGQRAWDGQRHYLVAAVLLALATRLSWSDRSETFAARAPGAAFSGTLAKVVVTDVDGTLMDSAHRLPSANRKALRSCLQQGLPVILATGKHCGPWVDSLIKDVIGDDLKADSKYTLNAPGVFVQGLLVRDASGHLVHTQALPPEIVSRCLEGANAQGRTVLAYTDDNRIVSNRADSQTERLRNLKEPAVEVGTVEGPVLKMLFLAAPEEETSLRQEVSSLVGQEASITVAIPGMVEVLPRGASKADGVKVALGLLGLSARDALALGDGENDLELLQLVRSSGGMAVAVGNARPALKEVASAIVASCDEAGWAAAVEYWALGSSSVSPGALAS
ncbi:unnamed protein product [Polarella glacialis]|uniref:Haloacid dehalogenase-like hydrolase n=2 Tax=Polarella glacialis TaxID=89957 RepID=A0A813E657_POLGL|nr:unnamed protein product [Polarella glacialis]